ncbi:sulfotransferase family 2 domain-containing protein [Moorena sp. SIO3A2]|uniref:sulfotransferase family 2 domain-containing protein n=1 Tax=Moorena sp. SIO3A2 TaxID=2607841 RepID=UPI0013BC0F03|nr:sulfotransferase family 2 domain-containing protein [Moorena sp. SIO3A2]NER87985.1 sulfotransferase family protein [Moorena sp. SIO3A2]
MISHDNKFIFIHIPKCAGKSMQVFFKEEVKALGWQKEEGLEYTMRMDGLAKILNLYPDYFTLTFIRNPFDRFVSIWKHSERVIKHTDNRPNTYFHRPQRNLSLNEYAKLIREGEPKQLSGFDHYHSKKQVEFILDYNQEYLFGIPRKTKDNCNFIGRFENLKQDFAAVCELLGIKNKTLPHVNNSQDPKHYSDYYDEETVEIVRELYAEDIEYLGYSFNSD